MLTDANTFDKFQKPLAALFVAVILGACAAFTMKLSADFNSKTVAQILIVVFSGIAVTSPRAAVIITFIYLAVLGDIRRWFQVEYGVSTFDLLLIVGPITALVLAIRLFFAGKIVVDTKISKWVMLLMAIMALQVFNLAYVPLVVNLAGVMFYMIPLVWFWIGKELGTEVFTERVLFYTILVVGICASVFGLYQVLVGFPEYQLIWIRLNAAKNIVSLNVGARSRPFGFFVSGQEYSQYLTVIFAIAMSGFWFRRFRWLLLFLPVFAAAILTTGSRGPIVGVLLAAGLIYILLAKAGVNIAGRLIVYSVLTVTAMFFGLTAISQSDFGEDVNPLLQRQSEGLLNPLDQRKSTATDHGLIVLGGLARSVIDFGGRGLGATTLAGSKFGVDTEGTELDISNMFISLSPVGGIIYVILICCVLKYVGLYLRATKSAVAIAVMGLLITSLGHWLTGNLYALSALTWFCVGSIDRQSKELNGEELTQALPIRHAFSKLRRDRSASMSR